MLDQFIAFALILAVAFLADALCLSLIHICIKRGIMEMADGIIINKADGDKLERARLAATQFRNALHLFPAPDCRHQPY